MRICRFNDNRLGLVRDGMVADVTSVLDLLPEVRWPAPKGDLMIANLDKLRPAIEKAAATARAVPVASVRLNSPVANPTKIIAAPGNYVAHNKEMEHVAEAIAFSKLHARRDSGPPTYTHGVFLKANSSLVGPSEGCAVRWIDRRNDHELELAVIIGKQGSEIALDKAYQHVAGYAIGLDMSVRGQEERSLRKSVDGYSVVGPWLVTADEIEDPQNLDFRLTIGGEVRQESNTRLMIVNIREIIAYASRFYTLYPGDVVLSGTSSGVGPVKPGDVMHCEFQGIGSMDVPVTAH